MTSVIHVTAPCGKRRKERRESHKNIIAYDIHVYENGFRGSHGGYWGGELHGSMPMHAPLVSLPSLGALGKRSALTVGFLD